jgi:hypothetical protein
MMGLMTVTVGLATAAGNGGNRTAAEVPQLGDVADQLGALVLQDVQGLGHVGTSLS